MLREAQLLCKFSVFVEYIFWMIEKIKSFNLFHYLFSSNSSGIITIDFLLVHIFFLLIILHSVLIKYEWNQYRWNKVGSDLLIE